MIGREAVIFEFVFPACQKLLEARDDLVKGRFVFRGKYLLDLV